RRPRPALGFLSLQAPPIQPLAHLYPSRRRVHAPLPAARPAQGTAQGSLLRALAPQRRCQQRPSATEHATCPAHLAAVPCRHRAFRGQRSIRHPRSAYLSEVRPRPSRPRPPALAKTAPRTVIACQAPLARLVLLALRGVETL